MKDKGLVWQVEYQTRKLFKTEAEARRFYKKTWGKENLITTSIRHRIEDNVSRIIGRVIWLIFGEQSYEKLKKSKKEQEKVRKALRKAVREILKEMVT